MISENPPGPEHVLVELLELTLTIVERELLIDWIGEFVELFIIGGIAFPFRLFDKRVDDLLQQCGLKTEFHSSPQSSNPVWPRRQSQTGRRTKSQLDLMTKLLLRSPQADTNYTGANRQFAIKPVFVGRFTLPKN